MNPAPERIHDSEHDVSESTVRALLSQQCPNWAERPLTYVRSTGTTNALWRVAGTRQRDLVVRMPRTQGAEASLRDELNLLPILRTCRLAPAVALPELVFKGQPADCFPLEWAILAWIEGDDLWSAVPDSPELQRDLAVDLGGAVRAISTLEGLPAPERQPGSRGGPLPALLEQLERWLGDPRWAADGLIDTTAVRHCAAQSAEVADEPVTRGFVHGDLLPGNVLTADGKLSAIIDWGGAGYGDLAEDLDPAWSIFGSTERYVFRSELEVDEATWLRGRAFALEHAVGGVLYYRPRRHPLGDVMTRTLDRILADTG